MLARPGHARRGSSVAMSSLSEAEFDELAATTLRALLDAIDQLGDGVEAELSADILSLEFEDDAQYVINSHRAARQIWMAAEREAWHFSFEASSTHWVASKTNSELWNTLESVLSKKLERDLKLER